MSHLTKQYILCRGDDKPLQADERQSVKLLLYKMLCPLDDRHDSTYTCDRAGLERITYSEPYLRALM